MPILWSGLLISVFWLLRFLLFLLFGLVKSGETVLPYEVNEILLRLWLFRAFRNQRQRLFAGFVERNHLECPFCRDCNEVGCHLFVGRVCNLALEYVGLEVEVCVIGCFQTDVFGWHLSYAFYIGIDLEVETAFQLCTLARQLLGVERDVLESGGACSYAYEVGHPGGTAQGTSAWADSTDAAGFLTSSYLFHLDAYSECLGENLDEFAEIDTFVGNIVEYGLVSVALIFDIADFHVEIEIFGYLSGFYHRVVFAGFCLFVFFNIGRLCLSEYALYLCVTLQSGFFHL
ncbi:hypothetical protein IMSAG192_00744 [Muribaculaceae bacterium]|nr:hypothetical protein IMSAG192_00744 [Muribaculaceae bacterium]